MKISRLLTTSFFFIGFIAQAYGQSALFNNQKGADIDFSSQITTQKVLKLDDPFLVQLFARWKSLGALEPATNDFFDLIFAGEKKEALRRLEGVRDPKIADLKTPIEMYLLYREGHFQSFLSLWMEYSSESNFLNTELGLAFDQYVAPGFSLLLMNAGFHISESQSAMLGKIESQASVINYSLQAIKALRTGKDSLKWIGKLSESDELRVMLAQSAVLDYAREGQLGASGKLISQVIEPWMQTEKDLEKVALHYLTLGRLLYQARAFDQAEHFYYLIPESSRYFVEARTEILWSHLQKRDFSKAKGQLATLRLSVFKEKFYPEIFLAQAIGNTMLCEFVDAKESIQEFIEVNKKWAGTIQKELTSKTPSVVFVDNYVRLVQDQLRNIENEREKFKSDGIKRYEERLNTLSKSANSSLTRLAHNQWNNRKMILEEAIYKMKFVRVELLSRMRAFKEQIAEALPDGDSVSVYHAATARDNQLVFPSDGVIWGDELFNMSAEVKNLCAQGKI